MSDRPTPETDALIILKNGYGPTAYEWREHSRRLERERDEAREERDQLKQLLAAENDNVDAYLGVCTERDEAREKAERYRLEANAMMLQRDEAISKL